MSALTSSSVRAGALIFVQTVANGELGIDLNTDEGLGRFYTATGIYPNRYREIAQGERDFTFVELGAIAQAAKLSLDVMALRMSECALNVEYPQPDWVTDPESWALDGREWTRANRACFFAIEYDGIIRASVAVEQYETLGETPEPPALDVYVSDTGTQRPLSWEDASLMSAALQDAVDLVRTLDLTKDAVELGEAIR